MHQLTTDYVQGFIHGAAHALDTLTPKETDMPKKTRPTRANRDRQVTKLAADCNAAFFQVAAEIDQLRQMVSAIAEVQGITHKVIEHVKVATTPTSEA